MQSLFFLCPSSETCETRKWPPLLASLSRACTPLTKFVKKGDWPIKTTVTDALVLILTGKYEMNNKPRAFRVKITRTCNSPWQDHGTWCHKSLRSVPSDPEEVVYYHFAEERTHKQCTCQKFCREVVPRFFAWEHLSKMNSLCFAAKEMCIWGWINIRYLHADKWHSFVVFVQFFGDSFNPERLKVNFEISLLLVILMHSSKISEGKVFLSAYLPWVIGNHALRLLKIVLADGWIVYRMRWYRLPSQGEDSVYSVWCS